MISSETPENEEATSLSMQQRYYPNKDEMHICQPRALAVSLPLDQIFAFCADSKVQYIGYFKLSLVLLHFRFPVFFGCQPTGTITQGSLGFRVMG
jgi:hypothetical protein